MKKVCLLCLLMLGFVSASVAQNVEEKKMTVKVLAAPAEKNKCLLELDGMLYLVTVNDVQLINKEHIASIQMYMPGTEEFQLLITKAKLKDENIGCAFCISTHPGTKLPAKFAAKEE